MHVSSQQMATLALHRQIAFIDRLAEFIENKTQRPPERPALAALCARAQGYGLRTERQMAGYITLAWASGAHDGPVDPDWIATVMHDPSRRADDKVQALFAEADRFPRARS